MQTHGQRLIRIGVPVVASCLCLLVVTPAVAASVHHRAYCRTLSHSHDLRRLSGVVAGLGSGPASRSAHLVLIRSAHTLRRARHLAPARLRSLFSSSYRPLMRADEARTLTRKNARRMTRAFSRLDRRVGRPCGLPKLLRLPAPPKVATAPATPTTDLSQPTARFTGVPVAHAASLARDLCPSKDDGRASIPDNFVVDVCWDGATLHLVNRTSLVQRVSGSGVSASARTDFPPQEWPSWIIAQSTDAWVLPPNYGLKLTIGDSAASISVSPAETTLLETYGLTKVLVGYLPFDPLMARAVADLVHSMDNAVARGRQCMNGANVLKKVACGAQFSASAAWAIGSFVVDASLDSIKKDAVKGTLKHAVGVLWGLVQEGKYIGDVFGDVIAPGSTRLSIAAAPQSPPTTQSPPTNQPPSTKPPSNQPPTNQPPTNQPPNPPQLPPTWREQETPNHPVNTFTNYHNASGMGPAIAAGQWVDVSCKVYDPFIASVNPDGYWYRIASSPWNNAYYSPANTFMNGDPYGGPYTHNTDFAVPNC